MSTTTEVMAQIMPVLNSIGEKLGVASAHLWEVMVKQAFIGGIYCSAMALLAFFFMVCSGIALVKLYKNERLMEESDGLILMIPGFTFPIALLFFCVICKPAITGIANPEYAAFTDITDRLTGGRK